MSEVRDDTSREKMTKHGLLLMLLLGVAVMSSQGQMVPPQMLLLQLATNAPVELKVTAVDGSEIDLSKLRGKIVLLEFWATWCGPCLREAPTVSAAYKKFHERGFEIIGISLDENKESLLNFTKARGITWPQYFDENKKVSQRFGIEGIPTMWLLNKQGMIANLDARTDLAGSVEKLLAQ